MSLAPGSRLGPYEIVAALGAGGMGEVFRARDTRLERTVAIKILPADRIADSQRKARFLQEARAASALNHPNIVTLHDIAEDGGLDFLVMECVPGKPLAAIIPAHGLPLREALDYAIQIASALAAAHAAGIAHRDIKPSNVIVTPESQVKVLDFGLAKLTDQSSSSAEAETRTQRASLTESGAVVGTVAYMSPEQAAGRPVDHRTDIFSAGIVLYEMISGRRPFQGPSHVETMHAIIHDAAPVLGGSNPPELDEILAKALAKEPKDRYHHAGDFALDLRRFERAWESKSLPSMRGGHPARPARPGIAWALTAAALIVGAAAGWFAPRTATPAESASAASIEITPFTTESGYQGEPSISPDGQTIAYVSNRTGHFQIYLRQVGATSDVALTHDESDNIHPAFSPDGRQIAFASSREGGREIFYPGFDNFMVGGDIWVMPTLGGAARRIARAGYNPCWSPDGSTIVFAGFRAGLFQVPASGGEAREVPITNAPGNILHPVFSSDGKWIIVESLNRDTIYAVPAAGGKAEFVTTGRQPSWDAAAGAIVYVNSAEGKNHSLWTIPFSSATGKAAGKHRPLTLGRGRDWQPAVSRDGRLIAYAAVEMTFNLETTPFDAEAGRVLGAPQPITSGNQVIAFMRFSPNGQSVVYESARGGAKHIWKQELRGAPVQLTADPAFGETFPQWLPDGNTIAFIRNPRETPLSRSLWLMAADGANPRKILDGVNLCRWLPDGSGFVYMAMKDNQLYVYDLASGHTRAIGTGQSNTGQFNLSPDGRWVGYQVGGANVDARAIPVAGGQWRVVAATPRQDFHPFFSPTGRWFYFQPDHKNLYRVPGPAQNWAQAEPAKVTDFPESGLFLEDPQFSPDGKLLLFSRGRMSADIWLIRR
jgi:serine/threonine protein kinase